MYIFEYALKKRKERRTEKEKEKKRRKKRKEKKRKETKKRIHSQSGSAKLDPSFLGGKSSLFSLT